MSEHTVRWIDPSDGANGAAVLSLAEGDDVGVALRNLAAGDDCGKDLRASTAVPKGHKIAMRAMDTGQRVAKYGQMIGYASAPIAAGAHVHVHNLEFRNSEAEHAFASEVPVTDCVSSDQFQGYRRSDGRVGTRNFIAVISSVNCSATVAHRIADVFDDEYLGRFPGIDGVAAFTHGTGCGIATSGEGFDNLQRVIGGYAKHPNVVGVLLVGLGCEASQIGSTVASQGLGGPLLRTLNIQTTGGHLKTIAIAQAMVNEMLEQLSGMQREACEVGSLSLALQCGGSDAWSGITANPALGVAADLLVRQGGRAVLAETPEIYGAEHLLTRRAATPAVAQALMERIAWWQDYVTRNSGSLDNNPSPGNKLGGLTTILEKSLGAVAKSGSTALTGVYRYAESVDKPGFAFMDSPGYDPVSVTGQIATGCTLVAFTTGRGSTFGSKPAPCIKIATNTDMFRQLEDDMDIDAGVIVSAGDSVDAVGQNIYERLLEIASGSQSLSEKHGLGDHEFVPWQIGATM